MRFMVEGTPRQTLDNEALALIPAETARGQEVQAQGLRTAIYVAADWSKAWQVYQVDSQEQLQQILASFPLHSFTEYRITPLAEDGQ